MKKFCEKAFGLRVLFCLTIVFIITAIAMGICIDTFLMQDSQRTLVSVLVGLTIAIFGIYLIVGYFYHIINFLVETHKQHGNVFKHYINDKNYRFSVNNTISCVYILITAFVNFVLSFSSF